MFTGIIEEMGKIIEVRKTSTYFTLTLEADQIIKDLQVGDSVSVNGVCLTAASLSPSSFTVDIMPETVNATDLYQLSEGSFVNLERSMPANGRFGGHFVSGHVDGTGEIVERKPESNAVYYRIRTSAEITRYLVMKGSVAVDGASLTVFDVTEDTFTISLIPHTLEVTVLGRKETGDKVNIECDVVGKYIEKLMK
ncbi:MAG TPA: riboflavin synthase [Bacillales bacterium]|nr:riboflavin synthase [Bacillales bacterium]